VVVDVGIEPAAEDPRPDVPLRSFAEVFETQRPGALRIAYAMTGDPQLAEDVVAEAFARVYGRWVKGGITDPDAYVRRAVVNEVRMTWRRLAIRRRYAQTQPVRNEAVTPSGSDSVDDVDLLQRALATLSPPVRAVVILRIIEDLSEQQTADALGCSKGTVKSHLSRGLDRLRTALAADEGGQ
jgi:RNA polymerase sigma-70 factor (sigma-E family)